MVKCWAFNKEWLVWPSTSFGTVEILFNKRQATVQASPLGYKEHHYWLSMSEYLIGRAHGHEKDKNSPYYAGHCKDDLFNIFLVMAVGSAKLNRPQEASLWIQNALEVYPGNRYALEVSMQLR